jgi:putative transposase
MAFWKLNYHLVWGTKNNDPFITPKIEAQLYPYLVNKAHELEVFIHAVNGWTDHTHVVASIPPKYAVAEVVKRLKGSSSFYISQVTRLDVNFKWKRGYGAFSLGETQLPQAIAYVENQKVHHQQQTTNAWLERTDELDEGSLTIVKESKIAYVVDEKRPFP